MDLDGFSRETDEKAWMPESVAQGGAEKSADG